MNCPSAWHRQYSHDEQLWVIFYARLYAVHDSGHRPTHHTWKKKEKKKEGKKIVWFSILGTAILPSGVIALVFFISKYTRLIVEIRSFS